MDVLLTTFLLVIFCQALCSSDSIQPETNGNEAQKSAYFESPILSPSLEPVDVKDTGSSPVERDTKNVLDDLDGVLQGQESQGSTGTSPKANEGSKLLEDLTVPQVAALQGFPQSLPLPGGRGRSHLGGSSGYGNFNFQRIPSCGMCSRERNLCQIISGIFTRSPLPYGYSLVTHIPAGVCNISIVELKPSKNFFALRRSDLYVLNGNWKIQGAGSYGIGGAIFEYSPANRKRGEKLESPGPLLESLDLMIIYQSPNPGIKYEYRVPLSDITGQHSSRRIQGSANPGSIASTFGLQNSKPLVPNHQQTRVHSPGISQNIFPNSPLQNPSVIPFQGHSRRPGLTPNQATVNRQGFLGGPQSSGNPLLTVQNNLDSSGQVPPSLDKNWGSSYIPPGAGSTGSSRPSNNGILNVPLSKVPNRPSRIPNQFSNNQGILTQSKINSPLPNVPIHELLNTEARTVPFYPITEIETKPDPPKTIAANDFSSPSILGHSFTPRTTSVSSNPALTELKHHSRHRHGSSNIVPGPAIGSDGLPLTGGNIPGVNSLAPARRRSEKRKNRKKGKKKRGKKRKNKFLWVFKGLTECSKTCGGGNQTSVMSCVRKRKNKVVSDRLCEGVAKPENKIISCNLKPCPAKWVPLDWGPCSVTCGYGIQTRKLSCKQEVSQALTIMVTEGACLEPKESIETNQVCNLEPCPKRDPHWVFEEWTACSVSCGNGTRARSVRCFAGGRPIDDSLCQEREPRPDDQEPCHHGSCIIDTWYFSEWSDKCSETCGEGVQTRQVFCLTKEDGVQSACPENKPEDSRSCIEYTNCAGTWFAGPWSECSVSCGSGRETRAVACLVNTSGNWKVAPHAECLQAERPSESRACILESCQPEWYTSEWGECSNSCGSGSKERQVKCYDPERRPSGLCSLLSKPPSRDVCNTDSCPSVFVGTSINSSVQNVNEVPLPSIGTDDKTDDLHNRDDVSENSGHFELSNPDVTPKEDDFDEPEPNQPKSSTSPDVVVGADEDDDNSRPNELHVEEVDESLQNVIPGKDAQGDESAPDSQEEGGQDQEGKEDEKEEEKQKKGKGERKKKKKDRKKKSKKEETKESKDSNCMDRIKNCHLVFRARLCPLKYYNKLCCSTCRQPPASN